MRKITKVILQYRDGVLPEHWAELSRNADETDLRILTAVLMLADRESGAASVSSLAESMELTQAEVDASLKFWRGAGILGTEASAKKQTGAATGMSKSPAADKPAPSQPSAHRNGMLEQSSAQRTYTAAELAPLVERHPGFVDAAQRVMGKIFNHYDTSVLMGLVDQLGLEEEAVLEVLSYTVQKGNKTMRYAERVAMDWYDRGMTDAAAIAEHIKRMEQADETISQIRRIFGMGSRALTAAEKKLFNTWIGQYAYDIDVIRLAYDITVDAIQKPVPKYTNSILEKWYTEGLHTAEEVRRYLERQKSNGKANGSTEKSYDTQEFFEAALQRSYGDTKL